MQVQTIEKKDFLKRVKPYDCFFTHGDLAFNRMTDFLQQNITCNMPQSVKVNHTGIILDGSVIEPDVSKNIISKKSKYSIDRSNVPFALHMSIQTKSLVWNAIRTIIPFYSPSKQESDSLAVDSIESILRSIKGTNVAFYWVPLKNNPLDDQKSKNKLNQFLRDHPHIPYEQNIADALYVLTNAFGFLKRWFGNKNNMMCSELVVRIYQSIGIIPEDIDANTVYPSELLYKNYSDNEKMKKMPDIFGKIIYKVV